MKEKFLLYIDLLGFSDIVDAPHKVRSLYKIVDSLNAHKHYYFNTIVFSDTILVYNEEEPKDDGERNYLVWYAIEFAEDLHHRLTGTGTFFRAILTHGEFDHYDLENIECFFGRALVDAYYSEKDLPAIGLFIDDICQQHNEYFRTAPFVPNRNFVYLNRCLERLQEISSGVLPIDPYNIDEFPYIHWELHFLRDVYEQMRAHPIPSVRAKYLATWDLYHKRYSTILDTLRTNGFEPESICPAGDWTPYKRAFKESLAEARSLYSE